MNLKVSFWGIDSPNFENLGRNDASRIIDLFKNIEWGELLKTTTRPAIRVEEIDNNYGIEIAAYGQPTDYHFSIFFKRPKSSRAFFGLVRNFNAGFTTVIQKRDFDFALDILKAFLMNDMEHLEQTVR